MNGIRNAGRSVMAVLAGILAGAIPALVTDEVLRRLEIFPRLGEPIPDWLLAAALSYRTVYGVFGSYLTARLAPNLPMRHSMILGLLGLAVSVAGAVATWNLGPAYGAHWYPVTLAALAVPTAWAGGKWREAQLGRSGGRSKT